MYILAALGGRMEAAGIYTQSGGCCVKILLSFPSKPKTRSPPSWVFTTDRKAYVSSGAFYFLKTRHRHAVVVVVFKAYVDNHVWRTLWWSFRISISGSATTIFCCRMLAGPQRKIIHGSNFWFLHCFCQKKIFDSILLWNFLNLFLQLKRSFKRILEENVTIHT